MARIRRLTPEMIYRVTALYLADEQHNRLAHFGDAPGHYAVRAGQRITIAADTIGIPWQASLNELRFVISNQSGFSQTLAGALRTRQRLGSAVWESALPGTSAAPADYTLTVSVTNTTLGARALKSLPIRIVVE